MTRQLFDRVREQEAINERLRENGRSTPRPGEVPLEVIRRNRREGRGGFQKPRHNPHASDFEIPSTNIKSALRVRRYPSSREPRALYLHVHGGGWVWGAPEEHDVALGELAIATSCEVVSVDYSLAPEHPFPAGRDDVGAALLWALEEAKRRDLDGVIVGGESAGAHLALCAVLASGPAELCSLGLLGLSLNFGVFDLGLSPSARKWGDDMLVLSTPWLRFFTEQLLQGVDESDRRLPEYSPLFANLSGLPPVLLTVGTADPLLDDSLLMAESLKEHGVRCEMRVYPAAPHGFIAMNTEMGREGNRRIAEWVRVITE